jgi:hypothetical protein
MSVGAKIGAPINLLERGQPRPSVGSLRRVYQISREFGFNNLSGNPNAATGIVTVTTPSSRLAAKLTLGFRPTTAEQATNEDGSPFIWTNAIEFQEWTQASAEAGGFWVRGNQILNPFHAPPDRFFDFPFSYSWRDLPGRVRFEITPPGGGAGTGLPQGTFYAFAEWEPQSFPMADEELAQVFSGCQLETEGSIVTTEA